MSKPPIGIIGGMGPRASLRLCSLITELTRASNDQQNIPFILDSNCLIPDRTQALYFGGKECLPDLIASARKLETCGVSFLLLACTTAHCYYDEISASVHIPVINMVEEAASRIRAEYGQPKVGLLATTGTIRSGIFEHALARHKIQTILPSAINQEKVVMEAIYGSRGLKASFRDEPVTLLKTAIDELIAKGAEMIILGCTDISEALDTRQLSAPSIDPVKVLAMTAIDNWQTEAMSRTGAKHLL